MTIKRSYATLGADGLLLPEQTAGLVSEALIGAPNGVAPLNSSGAIPPDVLAPTGTPDGTKFLRDDNSWQSVGAGSHPDLATHDALGLATDAELSTHAQTAHGLSSHAIDGAFHSGATVLPTTGQKNALAGTSGTPGTGNEYVTTQDARNTDARTPVAHVHAEADVTSLVADLAGKAPTHTHPYEASGAVATHAAAGDPHPAYLTTAEGNAAYEAAGAVTAHAGGANPHPAYATDTDLTTHAATPHGGAGTWTTVIKTADESKNSLAVVADDALLKFTTLPNTNYVIRLRAFFLTNATADLKYRLVHGGTTTRVRRRILRTATADVPAQITTGVAFDVADVVLSTTGLNPYLEEDVILQVGAAGGLFRLQWSQVTSNPGPTTCLEGSYLEYALT